MKRTFLVFGISAYMLASHCIAGPAWGDKQSIFHKVTVEEVIQTTSYTYLHVKEKEGEQWLAVPSMTAKPGEVYYYTGGLSMKKFESKELHRTFDEVLFLGGVSTAPVAEEKQHDQHAVAAHGTGASSYTRKAPTEVKRDIKVSPAPGGITIAELMSNKEKYAGKKVLVRGEVTKYSPAIMDKNWIHLQDGSEYNGKFDLVITSGSEVKVKDVVTLEGTVTLNKDFGYGYFFDVIVEGATLK